MWEGSRSLSLKNKRLNTSYYSRYIIYVDEYEKCYDYQSEDNCNYSEYMY